MLRNSDEERADGNRGAVCLRFTVSFCLGGPCLTWPYPPAQPLHPLEPSGGSLVVDPANLDAVRLRRLVDRYREVQAKLREAEKQIERFNQA